MAHFFDRHLFRVIFAAFLAMLCTLLGGCVITQFRLGLATDPIGPYIAIDISNPNGPGTTVGIGGGIVSGVQNGPGAGPTTQPEAAIHGPPVRDDSQPATTTPAK